MDISDDDVFRAVMFGDAGPLNAFVIDGAALDGDTLDLQITDRLGFRARLRVSLPRTGRDQYWIYAEPDDAEDWASQLFGWIEEEVQTGGLGESRAREVESREAGGPVSYVIAEPYGWRRKDPEKHDRLLRGVSGDD